MLGNRDIVMIASARWNVASKVNCHHIAERLAQHNRVLFVESPGLRAPRPSLRPGGDIHKLVSRGSDWLKSVVVGPLHVAENLLVLSPLAYPMHGHRVADSVNRLLFGRAVSRAAHRLGFHNPLLWVFPPTGAGVLDAFPDAQLIYHCIDHYAGIHGTDRASINAQQQRLLDRAQLVFATSQPLARALAKHHHRVICVPNVADAEHFTDPRPTPPELEPLPRPIVGYVGHLSTSMIDMPLLEQLARQRPQWSLVLIGTVGDDATRHALDQLDRLPNVHVLGPRPYESVPAFIHGFDACIIPFARNSLTDGALPLKAFEYLAAGKPVVATPLEAMREEPLDTVVGYGEGSAAFTKAVESALATDDDAVRDARRAVSREYSWAKRFPEISRHAAAAFADAASPATAAC